jgi:hypothetical protein
MPPSHHANSARGLFGGFVFVFVFETVPVLFLFFYFATSLSPCI